MNQHQHLAEHGRIINDLIGQSMRLGGDHELALSLSTEEIEKIAAVDHELAMALLKYRAGEAMLRGAFRAAQNRLTKRANAAIAAMNPHPWNPPPCPTGRDGRHRFGGQTPHDLCLNEDCNELWRP